MSFLKHKILSKFANLIGTPSLIKKTNQNLINIFYHSISDSHIPHISPLYKLKSITDFTNDIDYITKYFEPVSIENVLEKTKQNKAFYKPSVHISFDDGLKEIYTNIFPILKSKGMPATVFVNSGFVDNKDLFYRYKMALLVNKMNSEKHHSNEEHKIFDILKGYGLHNKDIRSSLFSINYNQRKALDEIADKLNIDFDNYLKHNTPYLNVSELKEMQNSGFTIGAHSIDHPNYTDITPKDQVFQTKQSVDFVRDTFNQKNNFFAFPFSDFGVDISTFEEIHNSVDLSFGISGIGSICKGQHLQRIDMEKCNLSSKSAINRAYLVNYLKSEK